MKLFNTLEGNKYWYIFLTETDLYDLYIHVLKTNLYDLSVLRKSVFMHLYKWKDQNSPENRDLPQTSISCELDHMAESFAGVVWRWFTLPYVFADAHFPSGFCGKVSAAQGPAGVSPMRKGHSHFQPDPPLAKDQHVIPVVLHGNKLPIDSLCVSKCPITEVKWSSQWSHTVQGLVSTSQHAEIRWSLDTDSIPREIKVKMVGTLPLSCTCIASSLFLLFSIIIPL